VLHTARLDVFWLVGADKWNGAEDDRVPLGSAWVGNGISGRRSLRSPSP
jgi:hypothetical protein